MSPENARGDKRAKKFIFWKRNLFCGINDYPRGDSTAIASIPARPLRCHSGTRDTPRRHSGRREAAIRNPERHAPDQRPWIPGSRYRAPRNDSRGGATVAAISPLRYQGRTRP
jgi:hypothetical protein